MISYKFHPDTGRYMFFFNEEVIYRKSLGVMYTNRRMPLFTVLFSNKKVKSYSDYGEQDIPNSLI